MYFHELKADYSTKSWYLVLRGLLTLAVGITLVLLPLFSALALLEILGLVLLVDSVIIVLPLLLGRSSPHLSKILLVREVVQVVLGILLLTHVTFGLIIVEALLGLLAIFRGILELIIFVEARTKAWHRREVLLVALLFIVLGMVILIADLAASELVIDMLGVYLIVEGLVHVLTARRTHKDLEAIEHYVDMMISADVIKRTDDAKAHVKPEPKPDRSFLLPHIDVNKYRKAIILAPHPDDLEGFIGGLVYRLSANVISVVFCGGDKGRWEREFETMETEDYVALRLDESVDASRILGISHIYYLGYQDRALPVNEEVVDKVVRLLDEHHPDLIVSFEFIQKITPYPHPDHLATGNIVRQAVAKYDRGHLVDYYVVNTLLPNSFVDVSSVRRAKLAALACHTTQTDLNILIFPFLEKLFVHLWGVFSGVDYAEGYRRIDVNVVRAKLDQHHD